MREDFELSRSRDWRERLSVSRDQGTGFAAPGGEFTRALYEWSLTQDGEFLSSVLQGRRLVELGAGMMPFGYALAATCRAMNFVAVEPFYADKQRNSIKAMIEDRGKTLNRIPYKVEGCDMLEYLKEEPDDLLCILACGIEECILPGMDYRVKVESEIYRTLAQDSFFISSHSDLYPKDLSCREIVFRRPSNPSVLERLRLHGRANAFDRLIAEYPKAGRLLLENP